MTSFLKFSKKIFSKIESIKFVVLDQATVSLGNFSTNILLARYLGFNAYGKYVLLWMVVLFIFSLQEAMLVSTMMSMAPKKSSEELSCFYGSLWLQQVVFILFSALMLFIFLMVYSAFVKFSLVQITAVIIAMIGYVTRDFLRRYFFSTSKSKLAFLCDVTCFGLQIIMVKIYSILDYLSISRALEIIFISSLISIVIFFPKVWRQLDFRKQAFVTSLRSTWQFSKWLGFSSILQWFSGNLIIILTGFFLNTAAVGIIRIMQNIMGITHVLLSGLDNIVPIEASKKLHAQGLKSLNKYLLAVAGILILCWIAFGVPIFMLGQQLLVFLFGNSYLQLGENYTWVLNWYLFLYLMTFLLLPVRYGLWALEFTAPLFWGYILASFLSLLAGLVLLEYLHLLGALLTLTLQGLANLLIPFFAYRRKLLIVTKN